MVIATLVSYIASFYLCVFSAIFFYLAWDDLGLGKEWKKAHKAWKVYFRKPIHVEDWHWQYQCDVKSEKQEPLFLRMKPGEETMTIQTIRKQRRFFGPVSVQLEKAMTEYNLERIIDLECMGILLVQLA